MSDVKDSIAEATKAEKAMEALVAKHLAELKKIQAEVPGSVIPPEELVKLNKERAFLA